MLAKRQCWGNTAVWLGVTQSLFSFEASQHPQNFLSRVWKWQVLVAIAGGTSALERLGHLAKPQHVRYWLHAQAGKQLEHQKKLWLELWYNFNVFSCALVLWFLCNKVYGHLLLVLHIYKGAAVKMLLFSGYYPFSA